MEVTAISEDAYQAVDNGLGDGLLELCAHMGDICGDMRRNHLQSSLLMVLATMERSTWCTSPTAVSAGPLKSTRHSCSKRRYPISGAIKWGWYPSASSTMRFTLDGSRICKTE
ncbi:MAG: hypothetical protein FRX49_06454 [Trebouxia sp. A1-2]|nr:MAG: hypothetical protein FRX49_06454 [Trebouxia sp. A1-2]